MDHDLKLLAGMTPILDAMLADIERARRRIWIETYIVREDRLGHMLGDVLARAAARGVEVRLLVDALGSQHTPGAFFADLARRGIQAELYRPVRPFFIGLLPRDHSRIMLLDDVAYTGGSAWGDEWLPSARGGKDWHDVCIRLCGPVLSDLEAIYEERWRERAEPAYVPRSHVCRRPDVTIIADIASTPARVLEEHCTALRSARRRVWIENAYSTVARHTDPKEPIRHPTSW
jgi:cardiolipin synthase A/B